jgi:phosphoglycerate dehydrogenase-like enzyme
MACILVTANAFAVSGPEVAAPLVRAGAELVHAPVMGPLTEETLIPLIGDVDVVIASSDAYTARVLAAAPRLRGIVRWGVGFDSIDLGAATARSIVVANTPGANTEAVADYVFGLMLNVARHLCEGRAAMLLGEWPQLRGVELHRKTLGIVGFGAIGRAVGRRASGFSMRVLAHDPHVAAAEMKRLGAEKTGLAELLQQSDFVTLHAALTPDSREILDEAALRSMKPTAYLINCGRGALVDELALARALDEGWIAGAGVDCYVEEPPPADHPLRRHPRCFATPHNAFNTAETAGRVNRIVVRSVLDILKGCRPPHVVNPEVYGRGKVTG